MCVILQAPTILLFETGSLAGTLGSLVNLRWLDPPASTTLELGLQSRATSLVFLKIAFILYVHVCEYGVCACLGMPE